MGYIAVFSDGGRLVAFSGNPAFVRRVASELRDCLPPARDSVGREIDEARRRVLDRIAKGESGDQEGVTS